MGSIVRFGSLAVVQPNNSPMSALGGIAAVIDPNSGQITRASLNDEEIIAHPFTKVKFIR